MLEAPGLPERPEQASDPPPKERRDPFHQGPHIRVQSWEALWKSTLPSLRFLFQTEVHVYSFAVAANILLSFFPFLVVMVMLCKEVFHWQRAVTVIVQAVKYYFPATFGLDMPGYLVMATNQKQFSWISIFLLFFTANGIFEPLEVALNRIWRVKENRSFLHNQVVSLGLIFVCGVLGLVSISITAMNYTWLAPRFSGSKIAPMLQLILFEGISLPITMLIIFLIYWRLPNAKIPIKRIAFASILVGILLEILKYVNILTWPWLRAKLSAEVPPFVQSISIILWSFTASMIVLAGAEWSARVTVETLSEPPVSQPEPISGKLG
jgi:uncharacterized BrkB/YihY/UPF0761 family membrane protein